MKRLIKFGIVTLGVAMLGAFSDQVKAEVILITAFLLPVVASLMLHLVIVVLVFQQRIILA